MATIYYTANMVCPKCGENPKILGQGWCRPCFNAYMRAWRPKYKDLSDLDRRRGICRAYTNTLIRRGKLTRGPCEHCASTKNVEAHHHDYAKPREVRWLCRKCHKAEHAAG